VISKLSVEMAGERPRASVSSEVRPKWEGMDMCTQRRTIWIIDLTCNRCNRFKRSGQTLMPTDRKQEAWIVRDDTPAVFVTIGSGYSFGQ